MSENVRLSAVFYRMQLGAGSGETSGRNLMKELFSISFVQLIDGLMLPFMFEDVFCAPVLYSTFLPISS